MTQKVIETLFASLVITLHVECSGTPKVYDEAFLDLIRWANLPILRNRHGYDITDLFKLNNSGYQH